MADRPCLISDSRNHLISNCSAKPRGSKPTSPTYPARFLGLVRKGTEADISMAAAAAGGAAASSAGAAASEEMRVEKVGFLIKYIYICRESIYRDICVVREEGRKDKGCECEFM